MAEEYKDPNREAITDVKTCLKIAITTSDQNEAETWKVNTLLIALKYIADQAGPADMITIKRVANIALGRDDDE